MSDPLTGRAPKPASIFLAGTTWKPIAEHQAGDEVTACYLVLQSRRLSTKADKPYLRLLLGDRTGSVEAVIWDDVDQFEAICAARSVVGVTGRFESYQDRLQLKIGTIEAVDPSADEMEQLLPASPRDRELMERELEAQIASIKDRPLRALLRRCLGRDSETGMAFRRHPAATRNHHAYLNGLLEHTLSVTGACERLVTHYREQGVPLDRDLLMAGALLHDVGKTVELDGPQAPSYTTPGKLLGHIVLGIQLIQKEAEKVAGLSDERLLLLQHLIASHQGKPEWDSPRVPQTIEAFILHYADDLDAKINQARIALGDVEPGEWSGYDRSLGRSMLQPRRPPGSGASGDADLADSVIDLFGG